MKRRKKDKPWHWPFQRINFGGDKEYSCKHGIGHGGIHGCDSCCNDPNFPPTKASNLKYLEAKYKEKQNG